MPVAVPSAGRLPRPQAEQKTARYEDAPESLHSSSYLLDLPSGSCTDLARDGTFSNIAANGDGASTYAGGMEHRHLELGCR